MADQSDPFDIDDIRFSSDEDNLQKTTSEERSAGSLLAAFKSQRALSKPFVSPSKPPTDFDNDSVVEFDYEDELFEDEDQTAENASSERKPEQNNLESQFEFVNDSGSLLKSRFEEPEDRPVRRMKSIFDTISQLRSRSNSSAKLLSASTSPTRNDSESDAEKKKNSGLSYRFQNQSEDPDSPRSLDMDTLMGKNEVNPIPVDIRDQASDISKIPEASNDNHSIEFHRNNQSTSNVGMLHNPANSTVESSKLERSISTWEAMQRPSKEPAIDWVINESTPRLGPIPVPDRDRDIPVVSKPAVSQDMQTYFIQNPSTEIVQTSTAVSNNSFPLESPETAATTGALMATRPSIPKDTTGSCQDEDSLLNDNINNNESLSPSHSVVTVCDSNADFEAHSSTVSKPIEKIDTDPVECSSPTRRKAKTNALRHIKRKVDIVKRRQREERSCRSDSVERKRVEQIQVEQEERLKELERDKFLLESQLNQLSVSVSGSFRERLNAGAPLPSSIDDAQLEDIKKEMQSMEKIIEALNEENAKLYSSLRGEQISMKGTAQQMLAKNKNLRSELDLARAEIQELRASKLTTADEGAQEEIRRLKHSMIQQRNDFESKLRAAQSQIDSLRRKNEELEYRIQSLNYEPTSPRRQRPGTPIKSKVFIEKYEKEIADLREKLQWYIENQKLIDDLQIAIKTKDESIRTLQHRVDLLYAETKSSKKKPSSETASNHDSKRIRELESEIAQLKKQQPHKRAVSAMVKAANRPDPRLVQQLQKTIAELQEELASKDADYMVRMRNLRLECDKMRIQYDERVGQLLADKREHARPHERIRELEEQIEEMRETYRRKGKRDTATFSTQTDTVYDRGDREECDSNDYDRENESSKFWNRIKMVEDQNRHYQDRIHELETELAKKTVRSENDFDSVIAALNESHASQIDALQAEIRLMTESLRKNPETILDRTATSHLVASLQSQLDVAHRENLSLKESLIETQFELSRLRSMPTHVQISALELKLNEIESRHASREAGLREALQHLELQSESRSHQSIAKYETMVREKNAQINEFRTELDLLLVELSRLQQRYHSNNGTQSQ